MLSAPECLLFWNAFLKKILVQKTPNINKQTTKTIKKNFCIYTNESESVLRCLLSS